MDLDLGWSWGCYAGGFYFLTQGRASGIGSISFISIYLSTDNCFFSSARVAILAYNNTTKNKATSSPIILLHLPFPFPLAFSSFFIYFFISPLISVLDISFQFSFQFSTSTSISISSSSLEFSYLGNMVGLDIMQNIMQSDDNFNIWIIFIIKNADPKQRAMEDKNQRLCNARFLVGLLGCFGGMFIHLIIGSLYQWGIINLYITSYYRATDPTVTLENNAIAFPIMMLCIGVTMRLGLWLSERTHPLLVMAAVVFFQALFIFCSSYVPTMGGFIVLYGVLFGLFSGVNFMVPIVECNKYFPGKKMYVNGVVLTGTGLGSVVFGLFSYNFLNPLKIPSNKGYYVGTPQLQAIADKVPECLRWLSLLYLLIGMLGVIMITKVCVDNRRKLNQKKQAQKLQENKASIQIQMAVKQEKKQQQKPYEIDLKISSVNQLNQYAVNSLANSRDNLADREDRNQENNEEEHPRLEIQVPIESQVHVTVYPTSMMAGFCTRVFWLKAAIIFFGTCGVFLMTGNYKTYVKNTISNDEMLTVVGVVGSIGNGISRFFWGLLFNHTGYRFALVLNLSIQIIVFAVLRLAVYEVGFYLFLMFLNGCCMGGFFVLSPTFIQIVFGEIVGPNIYGFFWEVFGLANLVQYAYVSGLSMKITFNGVIYICLGMAAICMLLGIFGNFDTPWRHPNDQLGYCRDCRKQDKKK